jgi:hypothetical protein
MQQNLQVPINQIYNDTTTTTNDDDGFFFGDTAPQFEPWPTSTKLSVSLQFSRS